MSNMHQFSFDVGDRVQLGTGEWVEITATEFDNRMGGAVYLIRRYHADGEPSKAQTAKRAPQMENDVVLRQTAEDRRRTSKLRGIQINLRRAIDELADEIKGCEAKPWASPALADYLTERGWWLHDTRNIWLNGPEDGPDTYEASTVAEAWEYETG